MRIIIDIPDDAVKMLTDLAEALQTVAKTVKVKSDDEEYRQLKEDRQKELEAFKQLADEVAPKQEKVTLEQVRATMAEMMREAGKVIGPGAGKDLAKNLLEMFGAEKLSEVDPSRYAELKEATEDTLRQLREDH